MRDQEKKERMNDALLCSALLSSLLFSSLFFSCLACKRERRLISWRPKKKRIAAKAKLYSTIDRQVHS